MVDKADAGYWMLDTKFWKEPDYQKAFNFAEAIQNPVSRIKDQNFTFTPTIKLNPAIGK